MDKYKATSGFQSLRLGCIFWQIPLDEEVCPKFLGFMWRGSNPLIYPEDLGIPRVIKIHSLKGDCQVRTHPSWFQICRVAFIWLCLGELNPIQTGQDLPCLQDTLHHSFSWEFCTLLISIQNYLLQHSSGIRNLGLQPLPKWHIHIRYSPGRTRSMGELKKRGNFIFLSATRFLWLSSGRCRGSQKTSWKWMHKQ